jgi:hypothetical protein
MHQSSLEILPVEATNIKAGGHDKGNKFHLQNIPFVLARFFNMLQNLATWSQRL